MNVCTLVGRLTKDPEIKYSQNENSTAISKFGLAVDRKFKSGNDTADFLNCIAFGKTAEFIEKYFHKGNRIGITGHIQTGSYTNKDGNKVYTTDIVVDNCEFVESKSNADAGAKPEPKPVDGNDGFMNIADGISEELPFN